MYQKAFKKKATMKGGQKVALLGKLGECHNAILGN